MSRKQRKESFNSEAEVQNYVLEIETVIDKLVPVQCECEILQVHIFGLLFTVFF